MQEIYFVECEICGKKRGSMAYTAEAEAIRYAKALIIDQVKKMNVSKYLSAILNGNYTEGYINKKYRRAVVKYLGEFLCAPCTACMQSDYVFDDDPNDYVSEENADRDSFNDFECYCQAGCTVIEFKFGNRLLIDSDILTCPDSCNGYFRIKDKLSDFKVVIYSKIFYPFYASGSAKSQNILSVYCALDTSPKSLITIQKHIYESTGALISTKTIGEHISSLNALGFPVKYKYRSFFEADHGYYLLDKGLESVSDIDISGMGTNIYIMLVLVTLGRTDDYMRPSEIINYIFAHFNVNMSKSTILRHLKFLSSIQWIKESGGKYILSDSEVR